MRPYVRASVGHRISEMAGWIHLKLYSLITYIPGVMPVFSDLKKIQNWRFYGRISDDFLPEFKIVQYSSDTVLRDDFVDSIETLIHHGLYARDDTCLFRF